MRWQGMRFENLSWLLLALCIACIIRAVKPSSNQTGSMGLTKPASCQVVPQTDDLSSQLGVLQTSWPVLSSGQYGALTLFGTSIFSWILLRAQSYGVAESAAEGAQRLGLADLTKPSSILRLSREAASASGIFLFAFACEYFPLFASSPRTWNADDFAFYALLYAAVTVASVKKVKDASLLNRLQTDEWKGWMQWLFIMYHYCAATSIYNCIRVFICAYVWMTGFGNFIYFTTTNNFCLGRFIHMMWRLNFAVLMLMFVMNKSWMVYYICPLHTFYFVLTFLVCFVYKQGNHSDLTLRLKIIATFVLISCMWDLLGGSLFNGFWGLLLSAEEGAGGTRGGTLWEWYFRTSLDKYACAFGMLSGLNRDKVAEILGGNAAHRWIRAALCGVSVAYIIWWCAVHAREPKADYNTTNAFFAPGVVISFVLLRNSTELFRQYYFAFPAQLGRISLESYLLQYHIWLACSATQLLVVVPGMPKVNLLVTSAVFMWLANALFDRTAALKTLLFSDKGAECLVVVCKLLWGLLAFYLVGHLIVELGGGLPATLCISALLAAAATQTVKLSARRYQPLPTTSDGEVPMTTPGQGHGPVTGASEDGIALAAQPPGLGGNEWRWVAATVALWVVVSTGLWLVGLIDRRGDNEPVYRVPAGQYSNFVLGAGTTMAAGVLLALTARVHVEKQQQEGPL